MRLRREILDPGSWPRRLASLVDLHSYFLMEEFLVPTDKVTTPLGVPDLEVVPLSREDMEFLGTHPEGDVPTRWLLRFLDQGSRCLAIKYRGEIAAYSWYALDQFEYRGREFRLEPDHAYLFNARTYTAYRGKNLAPYLRNELMKSLMQQGVKRFFSITLRSNKASRRFKQKLGAKPVELTLFVRLHRLRRHVRLKRYSTTGPMEIR